MRLIAENRNSHFLYNGLPISQVCIFLPEILQKPPFELVGQCFWNAVCCIVMSCWEKGLAVLQTQHSQKMWIPPPSPFTLCPLFRGRKSRKGLIFRFSVTPWPPLRIMGPADKRNKLQYFVSCHPFFCITHSARWRDTDFKATILQNIECKILINVILATSTTKNMFHRLCILDDIAFSFKLLMEIVNRWWASRNSYHIETSKLSQQLLSVGTTSIKCSRNLVLCSARHAKSFLRNIKQD